MKKHTNTTKSQAISLMTLILTMHAQINSMGEMAPVHEDIQQTRSGYTVNRYDVQGNLANKHIIDQEGYEAYPMPQAKINSRTSEHNYTAYRPEDRGHGVKFQEGEFVDQEFMNPKPKTTYKVISNPEDNGLTIEEYDLNHLFTNNPSHEHAFSPGVPSRSSAYDASGQETSRTYYDPSRYTYSFPPDNMTHEEHTQMLRDPNLRTTTMKVEQHPNDPNQVIVKQYNENGKPSMYINYNRQGKNLNVPLNNKGQIDQSKINSMLTFDNNGEELYSSGSLATKAADYNLPQQPQTALGRFMSWARNDNKQQAANS